MKTPYVGFSNESLKDCPRVKEGDYIDCPHCKSSHPVESSTSNGVKDDVLGFFRCKGKTYLASVAGKLVIGKKADVSGEADL